MTVTLDTVEFHTFATQGIVNGATVLDLGANRERFSTKMTDKYGVRCIAVEANPELFEDKRNSKAAARYNLAIADKVGEVAISIAENKLGSSIISKKSNKAFTVRSMDLEAFCEFAKVDDIALLKMDIEGAEIGMFDACSDEFLQKIPQITVEFHDFCGMTPPATLRKCLSRLEALGFVKIRMSRIGHQDTLLIQKDLIPVGSLELLWLRHGKRNLKGAERVLRKMLYGKRWAESY